MGLDVRVAGAFAMAKGTFEGTSTPKAGGAAVPVKGKFVTLYERQANGSWKAVWDIFNSDLPAPGATADGADALDQDALALERRRTEGFFESGAHARAVTMHMVYAKTLKLASFGPDETGRRSIQLYGTHEGALGEAARILVNDWGVEHIDMNFGCPVRKVTSAGGGSGRV